MSPSRLLPNLVAHFTVGLRGPPGFATITILTHILGSLSIHAMHLGILGEYLGRM